MSLPRAIKEYGKVPLPSRPAAPPAVRKSDDEIKKDLDSLIKMACELGADRATVIPAEKVVVDPRVLIKCKIPMCSGYGKNLMCPPYCITPEETMKLVKCYKYGVFFSKEAREKKDIEDVASWELYKKMRVMCLKGMYRNLYNIPVNTTVAKIEGEAYYMGYYLAVGLGVGPCTQCGIEEIKKGKLKDLPEVLPCHGLHEKNCIFGHAPLARPSLEAAGIDVFATVTNVGWPVYTIGLRSDPSTIPSIGFYGLVLVT